MIVIQKLTTNPSKKTKIMNTEGKPLSKEILRENLKTFDDTEVIEFQKEDSCERFEKSILKSMDEYAEIEAIGFAEWQAVNGFYRMKYVGDGNLYTREKAEEKFLTIKELYQLYKTKQP
jgi:hypothetical protein